MVNASDVVKCLVVAPSWVGDMVMAQSLLKTLKSQNPQMLIDVLAPAWCSALTDFMPEVEELIEAPFTHGVLNLKARRQLAKKLKDHYEIAYVLPNSFKSALIPWLAKVPKRIGFIGEYRYGLLNEKHILDKQQLPLMVQRFVALAYPINSESIDLKNIPLPYLQVREDLIAEVVQKHVTSKQDGQQVLILCPGAEFGAAKQWPKKHYAAVARFYLELDWQVWLMGSEKDRFVCGIINELAGDHCQNLAGKTSLSDAIALMAAADLVVSNDSGLMHIAAALHKRLVAVYGSTDPSFTPPLNSNSKIERLGLECSPCFKRECPLEHLDCLEKLEPNQILTATQTLLQSS